MNKKSNVLSIKQEIEQVRMERPHVVILGAGASYAAFPNGDKNGVKLPLMNNIVQMIGLTDLISKTDLDFTSDNFEDIYSQIHESEGHHSAILKKMELYIYSYFAQLEIADDPTIYDHLILSLRDKDVIATFNWDPFIIQAYLRNSQEFSSLPRLIFLHGNVAVAYCEEDKIAGYLGNPCSKCRKPLEPSKLLFPIKKKDYHQDGFLSAQWEELDHHLKNAFMITLFGYGAPSSDESAISLMKSAWGDDRSMEQTEIIDIETEADLLKTWDPFIHSHHYETHSSFYDSWIARHPRRTGEAFLNQYYEAKFISDNPIPKGLTFPGIWS